MNHGASPSPLQAVSSTPNVPQERGVGPFHSLANRFERLLKRVRLLAIHCEQAPAEVRQSLKQLLDLAAIELEDGHQRLLQHGSRESLPPLIAATPAAQECLPQDAEVKSTGPTSGPEMSGVELPVDAAECERRIDTALGQLETSLAEVSELVEIPEAADLNAILARLEISQNSPEDEELIPVRRKPHSQPNTREQLLGFEVCRMESEPPPEEPPTRSPAPHAAAVSSPRTGRPSLGSGGAQPPAQLDLAPARVESKSAPTLEIPQNDSASLEVESSSQNKRPGFGNLAFDERTESESESGPGSLGDAGDEQHPGSSSARDCPNEQAEEVNPLDSIRPENLEAILALKQELEQISAKFRHPGSG